jgi:PncC family amidohydrolase
VTAFADTLEEAKVLCRETADRIYKTDVAPYIYFETDTPDYAKNAVVLAMIGELRKRGMTFATAESCTAGMIAARVGDIAGCSDILLGGIISYANSVKENVLGVPAEVLRDYGAVSEPCAKYMAEGARRVTGADIAVSVTGIAGPGGGTPEKPVGTVCFGIADADGTEAFTVRFNGKNDRSKIRRLTVARAMMTVIQRLRK